jgi:hypothetical protein
MSERAWDFLQQAGLPVVGLVACTALFVWLIVWIRARYWDNEDPTVTHYQMLNEIRDLHREGDLTEEEFRSIKGQLIERIDGSLNPAGSKSAQPEPSPNPSENAEP